jgi:glucose/arabinose dehydrogenase
VKESGQTRRPNAVYAFGVIRVLVGFALTIGFGYGLNESAAGATLPQGFSETTVSGGLSSPTAMDFAPDGRLFVCLQGGQLRVIKNGSLLATPFLTLTVDSSGERGLLGVAFDPNFASNNFVYVYYTVPGSPAHNRVSRFTANGDVAVAGSEFVLLNLNNLSTAQNHNGGAIHFGPDGKLYIAVGENANPSNAQTLSNLLGKVLRINSDGSIPSDNPFFSTAGARQEIWALGLRNPFTFAFQPGTGRMFINDVGQGTWEEINDGVAGSNYGWSICEGVCSPPNANFRDPLFQYGHGSTSTTGCAIVGGGFYNPSVVQFPASFIGKYFFADLCTGWIRVFDPSHNTASDFASGVSAPVDLRVATDGTLYYLSIGSGAVCRIQWAPTSTTQRIDSISPPAGRTSGEQQIRLTGLFANLSTVMMGGTSASWSYTNLGDTSAITVTTPAHSAGAVQIDLTPTSGSVYSKANAFAYLPTVFTDDTIMIGQTTAKSQHVIELRQAVDALRAVAGLSPALWTDPALTAGNTIKAVHILELRTLLDDVATRLGYATSAYADPGLTTGYVIKRIHLEDLRQRIRTIAG